MPESRFSLDSVVVIFTFGNLRFARGVVILLTNTVYQNKTNLTYLFKNKKNQAQM